MIRDQQSSLLIPGGRFLTVNLNKQITSTDPNIERLASGLVTFFETFSISCDINDLRTSITIAEKINTTHPDAVIDSLDILLKLIEIAENQMPKSSILHEILTSFFQEVEILWYAKVDSVILGNRD